MTRTARAELEMQLDKLLQQLNGMYRAFEPLFPWVLVRVLPKSQKVGTIWTPEKQNKVQHEGIVLATWRPCTASAWKGSELKYGERVLFAHFAGLPIPNYPTDQYRIVKECNWQKDQEGGIYAKVDSPTQDPKDTLVKMIHSSYGNPFVAVEDITKRYELIDRTIGSVTLSGI